MQKGSEIRSEALVLRSRTMSEDDVLVDILTPVLGRLHGVARHGRKSQKRFGTVLEALSWVQIRGRDAGGLVSLEEAALLKPWRRLDTRLPLLTAGFHALELVRQLVPERNPDARVFELLTEFLKTLDETAEGDVRTQIARFEYRLLDASGYAPNVKSCLACDRPRGKEEKFFFVYKEGGLYCPLCLPRGAVFEPFTRETAAETLSRFIEYQLGSTLKTRRFLTDPAFCG